MSQFKVIDVEALDNNLLQLRNRLMEIDQQEIKTPEDERTILVLSTSMAVMYAMKSQLRSLDAHLGIAPAEDLHSGDGLLDVPDFDRKYITVVDTGAENYEIPEEEKQKNKFLRVVRIELIDFVMVGITNELGILTAKDPATLTMDDKLNFTGYWAQWQILSELKKATEPLTPHLQEAFKAGVECTYLDGYQTAMYQYLQKFGYEAAA